MPEAVASKTGPRYRSVRHRGRRSQVPIFLGKFLRMFLYQSDWKVLPMAAVIAALVSMVIRSMLFITMEGTLMGSFALCCVAIWNGCFNSIQAVCRERDVVKREHRSGMHISSYIMAHLIYQAGLCLLQTVITLVIMKLAGVPFPEEGLFTPWLIVDFGITLFIITFAADTLSLLVSSLSRNTTTAMTVMPFVLIFQLVFSGGMLTLPEWSRPLQDLTISKYGLTALVSQSDYNSRPLVSAWSSLISMKDTELKATVTAGQVLEYLSDESNPGVGQLDSQEFVLRMTARDLLGLIERSTDGIPQLTQEEALLSAFDETPLEVRFTLGEAVDWLENEPLLQQERERTFTISTSLGEILDYYGFEKAHWEVQQAATAANHNPVYEYSRANIAACWASLIFNTIVCAFFATIILEFIDRDRR